MRIIADLHIHSGYSRATSKEMTLPAIGRWAAKKGICIVGTGDFTHPAHFSSICESLAPSGSGLFVLKKEQEKARPTSFMLTAEVCNIYTQGGKTRKVHSLIFADSIETAQRINTALASRGNVSSDGRPILGFPVKDLLKIVLDASPDAMLIPAHAWTPWFSIFGSKSGFDSIEECFGDDSRHIHAIETGLSSDPGMNRRLSALDNICLISNSDAHSPSKLGREANVFDCDLSYTAITGAIKARDPARFLYTIEFFPEEGKYHHDGHRACGIMFTPEETEKARANCPVCGRGLTVGVLNRIAELADRDEGSTPAGTIPSRHVIPLAEIVAEVIGTGINTKKVQNEYDRLTTEAGTEFEILLDMGFDEIASAGGARLAEAITRVRQGNVAISPGFDGEFGRISIFGEKDLIVPAGPVQTGLF
ncbi:MAG: endonuclease Q family protein [Deltaproteobacteria bacterium]